jgi:hypothetical protein
MDLLGRKSGALWNDDLSILAVDIGALDRAIVQVGNTHIGPINVTRIGIDDDAITEAAIGDNGLFVGAVGVHRVNDTGVQFENEQAADRGLGAG